MQLGMCWVCGGVFFLLFLKANLTRPMMVIGVNGIRGLEQPGMTCIYCV